MTIVGAVVAVVFIGAVLEGRRKKRRHARGTLDHRIQAGNTQGQEYGTPPQVPGSYSG
ncbi:hypothetical protein ncot_01785 [Nocardioides sp. JQ2195]|uniref:hypothetical protein n=1 Tax=Nocardioides sp. JQ2195 TaxID=2592334 RepID=UPI00143ED462|nr:hypothetical protein [Nocardioides sp. JQ2195]QIX25457.1 hypothetical protein ncot_01785 [Nocardioides sp. JQ2195]